MNKLPVGWRPHESPAPAQPQVPAPRLAPRTPELGEMVHFLTRNEGQQTVERPAVLVGQAQDPSKYDLLVFFSSTQDGRGPQEKLSVPYAPLSAMALDTWHFAEEE